MCCSESVSSVVCIVLSVVCVVKGGTVCVLGSVCFGGEVRDKDGMQNGFSTGVCRYEREVS